MPLLTITTNISLDDETAQSLCKDASCHAASLLGKPESYVMVCLQPGTIMSFAGDNSPCAMLELKSLGLPEQQTASFSESLCNFFNQRLGIKPERIYIQFCNPERHMWGWDRRTF
ncbi:MAG: phenylpyruvate tautomerase MIF-related protein [Pseudomonadota bacterium]|nr:phenylpyruvate tautomerase MIF-related protein [Pseudomonadota bacterium]